VDLSRLGIISCAVVDLLINTAKSPSSTQPISDLELIEQAILEVSEMLDRVRVYVRDVPSGQKKGDPAVGRYLMDNLGPSTESVYRSILITISIYALLT
jgi:translation initiation factor 3 subunit F